jgi:outer membrane protein TolC
MLFSVVIETLVTLVAAFTRTKETSMRIAPVSAVLVVCLLAPAAPGQAQAPGTPPPGETQASPAAARVVGRVLSPEEAIGIALETQPLIQARLSDYMAASHRVDQAFAPLLPQITGLWTVARTQSAMQQTRSGDPRGRLTVTTIRPAEENTSVRVSLSQVLFDFGKTFASTDAARRLAEQAQEDVELQRQLITLTVKESFININFARRLIRVQEQALERADLNLRSAQGFFEVGTRPKSDVARAEVDVANARVDLIRARNAERLARVALNTAMGIPVDTPTDVQDNLVFQAMTVDRAQLLSQALAQRPEYKQARLRVDEADARMRRAARDFFPDVVGGGYYGATRADMNEIWELSLTLCGRSSMAATGSPACGRPRPAWRPSRPGSGRPSSISPARSNRPSSSSRSPRSASGPRRRPSPRPRRTSAWPRVDSTPGSARSSS